MGKNKLSAAGKLMHKLGGYKSPAWEARKATITKRVNRQIAGQKRAAEARRIAREQKEKEEMKRG